MHYIYKKTLKTLTQNLGLFVTKFCNSMSCYPGVYRTGMFAVGRHSPEYRLTADGFTVRKEMGKYETADKRAFKSICI